MRILYVSQYFPPEAGAPSARVSELSRHWVDKGHEVTVLTGFPNHPTGVVPMEYRSRLRRLIYKERVDGIDVVRTWLLPTPNRKAWERIANYASFCFSAGVTGSFLKRPDVIIATSPQLLVGLSGWWISKIKRVPFIFEVRDLWPESIVDSDMGSKDSVAMRFLSRVASFLYRKSDHIVVVTPAFEDALTDEWNVPPGKISLVENGIDASFADNRDTYADLEETLGLQGKFVVSYIGTIGAAHGLDVVVEAAIRLEKSMPDVAFLFVGEGAEKERLASIVRDKGLTNIRFIPQQPRENIPGFIRASGACLVLLKKAPVFKTVIPTKMLEVMACERPIILGVEGQAQQVLENAGAGIAIEPENAEALSEAVKRLYRDADLRTAMGDSGRRYVLEHASRERSASKYIQIIESRVLV